MGKTFAEKILAIKSGKESTVAGEIVTVSPDIVLSHDNTKILHFQIYLQYQKNFYKLE